VGGKYPHLWHVRHMEQPTSTTQGSIMPAFPHLNQHALDASEIQGKLSALRIAGVPYTDRELAEAPDTVKQQAAEIAAQIEAQKGPAGLADKEIVALVAYLQRLGTDIRWKKPAEGQLLSDKVGAP
ncbi:cbb3-type cytochrome c oxidase subunit II, partial [Myxococcota bacterium]|nr:cbb3-type cytochrome c oxidase subunit II [Myxococcota bacterium]